MSRVTTLAAVFIVLAVSSLLGISIAQGQATDAASPARGHASVIAQGVAAMPPGDIAWRVTRVSDVPESDQPARATPGFILVDAGTLLLNELDNGTQTRLASGEAAFLPAASRLREVLMGAGLGSFYRIDLVAANEVNTAGNDALVFVGEPFASPSGNRDVDLVRDVLDASEIVELQVASQSAPTLLLVTSGGVELTPAGNDAATPVALSAGQGAALGGDVIVRADGGSGAAFVTAVVGSDVPPILAQEAAPTATPLPAPASLAVQALACPVAYEGTTYAADCVEPLPDILFDLAAATGVSAQGTTGGDGAVTFIDLIPDTYSLTGGVPGEFADQVVECADEAGFVPSEASQTLIPGGIFTLEAGAAITCQWYVIPENLRGAAEGTISVTVNFCPPRGPIPLPTAVLAMPPGSSSLVP